MSRHITLQFPDGKVLHRWEDRPLEVGSTVTVDGGTWVVSTVDPETSGHYHVQEADLNTKPPRRNPPRAIPVPWVDCPQCSWRHYPSTARGGGSRWENEAVCASCGATLALPVEAAPPER